MNKRFAMLMCVSFLLSCSVPAAIELVTIGNPGNPADKSGYGSVDYTYQIMRYAVSNADWADFDPDHSPTFPGDDIPVHEITWYQAAQFCNYQTSGNIYSGAYIFEQTTGNFMGIDRQTALEEYGRIHALPTEHEWHKAAYYDLEEDIYWLYANGSDDRPIARQDAMYDWEAPWNVDDGSPEQNGTYNMMGNVWEWTERIGGSWAALRGGAYNTPEASADRLSAEYWQYSAVPHGEFDNTGFRMVVLVPEPGGLAVLLAGVLALRKRRRAA